MAKLEYKNEVVGQTQVITLSGPVGKPYPWEEPDETINEKFLATILGDAKGDILIRLNSPGGDVFEGIAISNFLKGLDNQVTVEVTALAASAASIICMGADKVIMDQGSSFMIHEASTLAFGNKTDIQKVLNALQTIDDSLIALYTAKTGLSYDEVKELLVGETWFTAEEAVEWGFADEVKGQVSNPEEVGTEAVEPEASAEVLEKIVAALVSKELKNQQVDQSPEEKIEKPTKLTKLLNLYKER